MTDCSFQQVLHQSVWLVLNTGKHFLIRFLKPTGRGQILLNNNTRDFQNSALTVTGNGNHWKF